MVAFGECGFAAEIPAFAGMEGKGRAFSLLVHSPSFPFPRKRESPYSCANGANYKTKTGRFPLSREWECFFLQKKNIPEKRCYLSIPNLSAPAAATGRIVAEKVSIAASKSKGAVSPLVAAAAKITVGKQSGRHKAAPKK